jgi:hypothetical protein
MKTFYTLSILLIVSITNLHAQKLYINVAGGYSFSGVLPTKHIFGFRATNSIEPTSAQIVNFANVVDTGMNGKSYKEINKTYGNGAYAGLSVGYQFKNWMSAEISFAYFHSNTLKSSSLENGSSLIGNHALTKIATNARGISTLIELKFTGYKENWKVLLYAKIGVSIPLWGIIYHQIHIDAPNSALGNTFVEAKILSKSTFSMGFVGSLGAEYQVKPWMKLFAEMKIQAMDIRSHKASVQSYDINKIESDGTTSNIVNINTFPDVYSKEILFVKELDNSSNNADYNTNYDKTKPKEVARINAPFDNMGFFVGIGFVPIFKK